MRTSSCPALPVDRVTTSDFLGTEPTARSWIRDLEQREDGLWPRFEPDVMHAAIAAVAQRARWQDWQLVKAPTLLVYGQSGTIQASEVRRMRDLRPKVTHVVIPDAGHDLHLEQHDAWIQALTGFLES